MRMVGRSLEDQSYCWNHLPTHLAKAGRLDPLHDLLGDCSFMQAKINHRGPLDLVSDYDLVPDNKGLQIIREILRLSAHILSHEEGQFWPQLYG